MDSSHITDTVAKIMLQEILEHLEDDHLIDQYSELLEKRYGKPKGTIINYIFFEDLAVDEMIIQLNIDTITYL
ncbi:MAG: hypothetical protein P1U56_26685 [Saprospiraceae bacterium]|nr:hypothetical protein [Saprospiraceae bacterium]